MKKVVILAVLLLGVCLLPMFANQAHVLAKTKRDYKDSWFADIVVKLKPIDAPNYEKKPEKPNEQPKENPKEEPPAIGNKDNETETPQATNDENPKNEGMKPQSLDGWDGFVWSDNSNWFSGGLGFSGPSLDDIRTEMDERFQQRMTDSMAWYESRSLDFTNRYNNIFSGIEMNMQERWGQLNQYVDLKLDMGRQQLEQWNSQWRAMKQQMNEFFERARIAMGN